MVMSSECLALVSKLSIGPVPPGSTIRLRPALDAEARLASGARDEAALAGLSAPTIRTAANIVTTMEWDGRFKGSSNPDDLEPGNLNVVVVLGHDR
jgi:hypothetical protein